jgi:hypothetical protein
MEECLTNDKLFVNTKNSSVILHMAATYFIFLLNFMKAKPLRRLLNRKEDIFIYAEVETKSLCCLELFYSNKQKEDITSSPK